MRILLVDDDVAMLRLLSAALEGAGYAVTTTQDAATALDVIDAECPQFLLTDWEMPHMDGIELCRALRARKLPRYVYTILITARSQSQDVLVGLEAGADDFLKKPVDKDELFARLMVGRRVLEMESRLIHLANSDPLTGLPTKRVLNEYFEREWSRARRYDHKLSCVMLDLDFFKKINDEHGHPVGDQVLRCVAEKFEECCHESGIVSRYGGEEFCAVLPRTSEADALVWAERLCDRIEKSAIDVNGASLRVTASAGVAELASDVKNREELLDRADQALLMAKQTGRNRVVPYQVIRQASEALHDPQTLLGSLFHDILAKHVMTSIVAGLQLDATVGDAAEYFLRFRLGSAPVVDSTGKLVGFVSDRDLMNVLTWPNSWELPIRDVMRASVICYPDDTPAISIYEFLCRVSIRSVVVSREGAPIGVIHRGSLLRWFSNTIAQTRRKGGDAKLQPDAAGALRQRRRLSTTVTILSDQVIGLCRAIADQSQRDLVPGIVGGVSRIQELTNDILAQLRFCSDVEEDQGPGAIEVVQGAMGAR
jgi:two-component system cell cycle response regulator